MANIKLYGNTWDSSNIYDEVEGKTQKEVNAAKANASGNYPELTAGTASQLIGSNGEVDKVPYAFRKTGGDLSSVGTRLTDKLVGGTIVWNQLADYSRRSGITTTAGVTYAYANNEFTATGAATENSSYTVSANTSTPVGHVFFVGGCAAGGSASTYYCGFAGLRVDYGNGGLWKNTLTYDTLGLRIDFVSGYSIPSGGLKFKPIAIDLTKMFGSTIADYIYDLETATAGAGVAYFRSLFPKSYYAYNAGTLMSVNAASHEMSGKNLYDYTKCLNQTVNDSGVVSTASNRLLSPLIRVEEGQQYIISFPSGTWFAGYAEYDANKTWVQNYFSYNTSVATVFTPQSPYIRLYYRKADSSASISISDLVGSQLEFGSSATAYEPYEKHVYPLDSTLTLRGIPKLDSNNKLYYDGDTYESDGTVTRRYGIVDMGSMTWTKSTSGLFQSTSISNVAKGAKSSNDYPDSIRCIKYIGMPSATITGPNGTDPSPDKVFAISQNGAIYVNDLAYSTAESYTTGIAGTYLLYELATPITESAAPYINPQICDPNGTEEYVDAGNRDVAVPVGHETTYYEDLVDKIEETVNDVSELKTAIALLSGNDLVLPDWFPELPFPVKKENGKWTFDDIDLTDRTKFPTQYEWKTYYVDSATGDDSNNGTSASTPFKTLKQAVSKNTGGGYPTRIILADNSVYYYPDTTGAAFTLRKSIVIEAENGATVIDGYSATDLAFELTADGIYASTESLSGKNIVGTLDMGSATLDDYGMHKAMTLAASVADVITTTGSYIIDNSVLYVNPYTSISNIVGLTSSYAFAPISSNPLDRISGFSLKNIRFVGNAVNVSRNAHNDKYVAIIDNCIFENNPYNNNLTASGVDALYIKNSTAGYAAKDGFNTTKGNMTTEQVEASVVVYANCKAKECGWYDTTGAHNANLSTAHEATNILRCGFVGYNADGPMIADVNGCYSVNYDVEVANNNYDYSTSAHKGAFEFNSVDATRATKQKCVNCYAYDKRSAYHNLVSDGDIWLSDGNLYCNAYGVLNIYPVDG